MLALKDVKLFRTNTLIVSFLKYTLAFLNFYKSVCLLVNMEALLEDPHHPVLNWFCEKHV